MIRDNETTTGVDLQESGQLQVVLDYDALGWSVIRVPAKTKKARIKWSQYQNERPDQEQLRQWFGNGPCNMAVILGSVSGGLTCRDFDTMAEYELWAGDNQELAKTLPTARTVSGRHVYFIGDFEGIKHIRNGELRGKGGYCLTPPSIHPNGPHYKWIIKPTLDNLKRLTPQEAGFIDHDTESTESTENTENTEEYREYRGNVFGGVSVEEAITETLPQSERQRNRKVFEFARYLKAMPAYVDCKAADLRDIIKEWHRRALPCITTKEFEETWCDFLVGWDKVKYPKGQEPMAQIFQNAVKADRPQIALDLYPTNDKAQLLVALCRELQRATVEGPFYLSCRTAGRLLDMPFKRASRYLFMLRQEGILEEVKKGSGFNASRYRYIATS